MLCSRPLTLPVVRRRTLVLMICLHNAAARCAEHGAPVDTGRQTHTKRTTPCPGMPRSRSSFCTIRHDRLGVQWLCTACLFESLLADAVTPARVELAKAPLITLSIDVFQMRPSCADHSLLRSSVLNQVARCCPKAQHLSQRRAAYSVPTKRTDGRRQPGRNQGTTTQLSRAASPSCCRMSLLVLVSQISGCRAGVVLKSAPCLITSLQYLTLACLLASRLCGARLARTHQHRDSKRPRTVSLQRTSRRGW
jgi:hypothetical protein